MFGRLKEALKESSLLRYIFVGSIAYLVDISVLAGLYYDLHVSRALAASASFWVGLVFSFLLQKLVAFQDYQKEVKALSKQALWYAILVLVNYSITVIIVDLFPGRYIIFSRTLAVAIATIWNYRLYKKVVFRRERKKGE